MLNDSEFAAARAVLIMLGVCVAGPAVVTGTFYMLPDLLESFAAFHIGQSLALFAPVVAAELLVFGAPSMKLVFTAWRVHLRAAVIGVVAVVCQYLATVLFVVGQSPLDHFPAFASCVTSMSALYWGMILMGALAEESLRRFVFACGSALGYRTVPVLVVVCIGMGFGHAAEGLGAVVSGALTVGLFYSALLLWCRSMAAPLVAHIVWNVFVVSAGECDNFDTSVSEVAVHVGMGGP